MSTFCPAKRAYLSRPSVAPHICARFTPCLPSATMLHYPTSSTTYYPTRTVELRTRRLDALASWSATGNEGF